MRLIKLTIALTLIYASYTMEAQKYGYVNTEELIASLPEVQVADSMMVSYRDSLTQALSTKVIAFQQKYASLEAKINEIPPIQLEKEKQALQLEEQEIQKMENEGQKLIFLKSQELLNPIQEKVRLAIKAVADEEGYNYIFDTSGGFVLYADSTLDVTNIVKSKL